jgi:hypothetical protein
LEQTIRGTESGLSEKWATPTTMDKLPPKSQQALLKEATFARLGRSKPANLRDQVSNMQNWPTPRSCSAMAAAITPESAWNEKRNPNLETIVGKRMWPTPVSHDAKDPIGAPAEGKRKTPNLAWRVNNWPSPKARDWKDGTTEGTSNRMSPDLGKLVGQSKETGSLNPTWVEWLMGWPLGWTDLKPLATDKCHSVQQQLGES